MSELSKLALIHHTDKLDHGYTHIYEQYLEPLRGQIRNVLEIGVNAGGSLHMWREYFPNARIWGIDINPDCKYYEYKRVGVFVGDQTDEVFLNKCCDDIGSPIDLIIDDGSHVNTFTTKTFYTLFPRLKSHGVYIIEDLSCSYAKLDTDEKCRENWPGMKLNKPGNLDNDRTHMDNFFNNMIHNVDKEIQNVLSVHFWKWCAIILKGDAK